MMCFYRNIECKNVFTGVLINVFPINGYFSKVEHLFLANCRDATHIFLGVEHLLPIASRT